MKKERQFLKVPLGSWPFLLILSLMIVVIVNWWPISENWSIKTTLIIIFITNLVGGAIVMCVYRRSRWNMGGSNSSYTYAPVQEHETRVAWDKMKEEESQAIEAEYREIDTDQK